MLCSVFTKKSRTEDQTISQESNKYVYMRMQASLLASAALTAEVAALKQDLKGSKDELGLAKRQLEENKGKRYPIRVSYKGKNVDANRSIMNFSRGHNRSGSPEEGAVRGRKQSSQGAHRAREARVPSR